jgi:hypothetical protein
MNSINDLEPVYDIVHTETALLMGPPAMYNQITEV